MIKTISAKRLTRHLTAVFLSFAVMLTAVCPTVVYAQEKLVTASHAPGGYMRPFTLTLSAPDGVGLYYTDDGSKPGSRSDRFPEEGILISRSCTVRVLAAREGFANTYCSFEYTITGTGNLYNIQEKYYYQRISAKQQQAYIRFVNALETMSDTLRLSDLGITPQEWLGAQNAVFYECPEYLINTRLSEWYFPAGDKMADGRLGYVTASEKNAARRVREFEDAAASVAAMAMRFSTDAEKVLFVTQWLVHHSKADTQSKASLYSAYGPLVKGSGLCKSYTDAFSAVMQILRIPVIGIHAKVTGDGGHAANMVCIDGEWYNIDTFWTDLASDIIKLTYFLTSDRVFSKTHVKDIGSALTNPMELPPASSDSLNAAAEKQSKRSWSARFDYKGSAKFSVDIINAGRLAPYSFKLRNTEYDVSYISRTFSVSPLTRYRFSARAAYSGLNYALSSRTGASIGIANSYEHSDFVKTGSRTRITYEFVTAVDQKSVELALYNGMYNADCMGTASFSDVKLERFLDDGSGSGRWITVNDDMAVGTGFSNIYDVYTPMSDASFISLEDMYYTGEPVTQDISVVAGGNTLRNGTDYTLEYSGNTEIGTAFVTAYGKGIYTGSLTAGFSILPPVLTADAVRLKNRIRVTWNEIPGADGYVIWRSVNGRDFEVAARVGQGRTGANFRYSEDCSYQFAVTAHIKSSGEYTEYTYTPVV